MALIQRLGNHLLVQSLDKLADTVSEVIPSSPGRLITSPKPLHGLIELGFFKPHRRGQVSFEVLIEHHFEQNDWIVWSGS